MLRLGQCQCAAWQESVSANTSQVETACGVGAGALGKPGTEARVVAMCSGVDLTAADFRYCAAGNRSINVFGPDQADDACVDIYTNNVVIYEGRYLMNPTICEHLPWFSRAARKLKAAKAALADRCAALWRVR